MLEELQDKYSDIEEISHGSTSIVYSATDILTKERVAIKHFIYSKESTDITFIEQWKRFKREIEIHLSLDHKNIIKARNFYQKGSKLYLIMDYVEGKTLQKIIDDNTNLDVLDCINIVKQVSEVLQYIDDKGIVHRDIKPGNIWVSSDNQVYVIDFGCAKKMYSESITVARMLIGTISYMSPEQLLPNYKELDGRTDIFALGCTFYYLLTKAFPFKGEDIKETIHSIFQSNPISVRDYNPYVPFKLEYIIHQTLKKDPDHRCPTAKLLTYHLNKILADPEVYFNVGKYHEQRNNLKKAYVFYKKALEINENYFPAWKCIANLYYIAKDWKNALEYYNYLIRLDSSKHEFFARLGDINNALKNYSEAFKMYHKAWFLNPNEKVYELKMANGLFLCNKVDEAINSYKSIISRHKDNAEAKYQLGVLYYKIGKINEALSTFEEARDFNPFNEDILSCLGALYQEIGNTDKSIEIYNKLEEINPTSGVVLHNLACAYYKKGEFKIAKDKLEVLIELGFGGTESYILLGLLYEKEEKYEEALKKYKEVIKFDPTYLPTYLYVVSCLKAQWRLNDAIEVLNTALTLETSYSKAEVYYQLAEAYREQAFYDKARFYYKECIAVTRTGKIFEAAKRQLNSLNANQRKKRSLLSILDIAN